jgi:nucleotide-binding universal stress UspA family protein
MYRRILVPLDGSATAERVLPYSRFVAEALKVPVELLGVIDLSEMAAHVAAGKARYLDRLIEAAVRASETYLGRVAGTFTGVKVECTTEKGRTDELIVDKAAADKNTLITMATHGRSGVNRWVMGSIAEKVLRSTTNPLLIIRAAETAATEGRAVLSSVVVPLDGSELAESVLPDVAELANALKLKVILLRAYSMPVNAYATEGYYVDNYEEIITAIRDEAVAYLERKVDEVKKLGVTAVSYLARDGFAAEEIIGVARETSENLIAMCTHGRSGIKRWALGSVTETVARHSGDPVLVLRANHA